KVVADLIAEGGLKDEWQVRERHVSLRLVVLKTPEIEKLRTFYECLGMTFSAERHGRGPLHYAGQLENVVLEVYPLVPGNTADTTTRLGLNVPKMDNAFLSLQALGTPIIEAPLETPWGYRAVVRDPDGRAVELY